MKIIELIKNFNKAQNIDSRKLKDWYAESYERTVIQRNMLIVLTLISLIVIVLSILLIRYVKSSQSIEPFVIEIESNTGVPTVVNPVTIKDYAANEVIQKYFIMKYINAREGYTKASFDYNYNQVVRALSNYSVYNDDYKPKFSPNNKSSPAIHGPNYTRTVNLKSILYQGPNAVQVRVRINEAGKDNGNIATDNLIYLEFEFKNVVMNDNDRLFINPLGFTVTLYRITDEKTLS